MNEELKRQRIGYVRVSTVDQNLDMQKQALIREGVHPDAIWADVMTGSKMQRPGLESAIKACWPGAQLVVWKLDRLGRSALGILDMIARLDGLGIELYAVEDKLDTKTSTGRFVINILAALAQMERDIISERTKEGMRAARARGTAFGRKHSIVDNQLRIEKFHELFSAGELFKMTGQAVIDAMNAADPKAPAIKGPQVYFNWKKLDFKGYRPSDFEKDEDDAV